jgi:hypothetical protein
MHCQDMTSEDSEGLACGSDLKSVGISNNTVSTYSSECVCTSVSLSPLSNKNAIYSHTYKLWQYC